MFDHWIQYLHIRISRLVRHNRAWQNETGARYTLQICVAIREYILAREVVNIGRRVCVSCNTQSVGRSHYLLLISLHYINTLDCHCLRVNITLLLLLRSGKTRPSAQPFECRSDMLLSKGLRLLSYWLNLFHCSFILINESVADVSKFSHTCLAVAETLLFTLKRPLLTLFSPWYNCFSFSGQ